MDIEVLASGSKGNCYKIKNKDTTLLVECGISIKEIKKKLKFNLKIDGCLVTHEHKDHSKAIMDLLFLGIPVFGTSGTKKALNINHPQYKVMHKYYNSDDKYIPKKVGSFIITPFKLIHDAIEPVGFKIEDTIGLEELIFITDTMYCPYKFCPDYLMLEVNYITDIINNNGVNCILRKRIKENHMSLDMALDFLQKCNLKDLKQIYVMHLSNRNSDQNLIKEKIQELTGIPVVIC